MVMRPAMSGLTETHLIKKHLRLEGAVLQCQQLRVYQGTALAISLRQSSASAKGVETAGVCCSSEHSPLVIVTKQYSDLFLRSRRVKPLFSAIKSLGTTLSR